MAIKLAIFGRAASWGKRLWHGQRLWSRLVRDDARLRSGSYASCLALH